MSTLDEVYAPIRPAMCKYCPNCFWQVARDKSDFPNSGYADFCHECQNWRFVSYDHPLVGGFGFV